MITGSMTARRAGAVRREAAGAGFGALLHAEWTKLRTVRGWVVGMVLAALLTAGVTLLNHSSCGGGCSFPIGPGGEAVIDSFYFVHQPLAGDGSITARVTSLTGLYSPNGGIAPGSDPEASKRPGLQPWAKAGIIVKASTRAGSAYAAMMVTGGHGVRMQYGYTGDIAGPAATASAAAPRWLRLTRTGGTLTGYWSADGTRWTRAGTAYLAGLRATAQAGLFATSPSSATSLSSSLTGTSSSGGTTVATARFDHVSLAGRRPGGTWAGADLDGLPGTGFRQSGGTITVTGSGNIAPDVPAAPDGNGTAVESTLLGAFFGLIAVIVVASMFMTAEYRRGLIRVTLAAAPSRGRVLAAKAAVVGSVTFLAGLAGSAAAVALGEPLLRSNGNFMLPVSTFTLVRAVAGTAALLAVAAVLALALGAIVRRSAAAITAVIAGIVLPYLLTNVLPAVPAGAAAWLLQVTPAAAFAIQQTVPRYRQVSASYTPMQGYFPLAPWAGFAVLCGYAAVALAVALVLLRRRDA
jgi:ABC-type transport system involved in multi-copper enzyme maturation permease subunit